MSDPAELERKLREALESQQQFELLASHIDQAFWLTSADERELRYVSPAYEAILGRSPDHLRADPSSWIECVHQEDRRALRADQGRRRGPDIEHRDEEFRVLRPDGSCRWVWLRSAPVFDRGDLVARVTVAMDITRRKEAEEELRSAAMHDRLTRLPNRAFFAERLKGAIRRAAEDPAYRFAVLFLDFDRFKVINDSLGHETGDQLLVSMASRLRAGLRQRGAPPLPGEGDVPARLGGDEFAILLDGIREDGEAARLAEDLQKALSAPHQLGGHDVISTASIGIVTSSGGYERAEDVLRDADIAMYHAKAGGRARHVVFDDRMHEEAVKRLRLEQDLRRALERSEFSMAYQPIVDLAGGGLVGFEALIRWNHPERGDVPPGKFIGLAEEIGLIVPIGAWALRESARQLRRWQDRFPQVPPLSMNVNLSRRQIGHGDLVRTVRDVLQETGIDPVRLKLEITESVIMDSPETINALLRQLKGLGVQLCMDDFGTGHSSLSCLHSFPIDVLKIDRSFVANTDLNREYAAVIQAIVTLAHTLKMTVVGEGVETAGQLAQLQALDCDCAQGNLFSGSMRAEAAEAYLKAPRGLARSA
jgi:diguanylate cyclase (GGDEF)-like protein/PAS domain S-box-containing protein